MTGGEASLSEEGVLCAPTRFFRSPSLPLSLFRRGQLEFINGGWCMHDEAAPSYVDMIANTALGHRLITSQFGVSAAPKA